MKPIERLKSELNDLNYQKKELENKIAGIEMDLSVNFEQYLNKWYKYYTSSDGSTIQYFKPMETHYEARYKWFDFVGTSITISDESVFMTSRHTEPVGREYIASSFETALDFDPLAEAMKSFEKLSNKIK